MNRSPRLRVANQLWDLGFQFHEDDIWFAHGGIHLLYNDVLERWRLVCLDKNDKEVEITGADTLTKCAKGLKLEPNTPDTCLYGDLVASAL